MCDVPGLDHDLPGRLAGAGGYASQDRVRGADLVDLSGLLHGQLHRLPVQATHASVDLVLEQRQVFYKHIFHVQIVYTDLKGL